MAVYRARARADPCRARCARAMSRGIISCGVQGRRYSLCFFVSAYLSAV